MLNEYTRYSSKEEPTDLLTAAKTLDDLMKDYDQYSYNDAGYSVQQAIYDLDNDPYMVVMELCKIIRNDIIEQ